jgi:hypothetical protein
MYLQSHKREEQNPDSSVIHWYVPVSTDPDPDSVLLYSGFQDANKKFLVLNIIYRMYIFYQSSMITVTSYIEHRIFLNVLPVDVRIRNNAYRPVVVQSEVPNSR